MKSLLTHSRQDSFKSCRKKHFFAYEIGLRRIDDAKALRMGSAFHDGIEQLAKSAAHTLITRATCNCKDKDNCDVCEHGLSVCATCKGGKSDLSTACNVRLACAAVRARYADMPPYFDPYDWAIEAETILRLVCAYQWRWSESKLENVATEFVFQLPLINPETGKPTPIFDVAGKIDGIVRLEDGRLAVKETKTSGEDIGPDSPLWRRLRMDHQISLYIHAARQMGYKVDTVLYDVCRKPAIAPEKIPVLDSDGLKIVLDQHGDRVRNAKDKSWKQSADKEKGYFVQTRRMTPDEWGEKLSEDIVSRPDFYFRRVEVPRLDADVEEYQYELWMIQQSIREAQISGRWFRTVSRNTCPFCPFFSICSEGWKQGDPLPLDLETVKDVHPELNEMVIQ